jgi:cyanophycinase-like exopeptidase
VEVRQTALSREVPADEGVADELRQLVRARLGRAIVGDRDLARADYLLDEHHVVADRIDEDTALVADGGEFRVVGSGAVTVLDLGGALASNALELTAGQHLGICDVRMHVLTEGYRFRLADRTPLPPDPPPPRSAPPGEFG